MSAQHTPGPWMVEPINDGQTYQVTTSESTGFTVICESEWGGEEDEANARLISAAPDMLAALEHLLDGSLSLPRFAEQEARAAVAKAKGDEA